MADAVSLLGFTTPFPIALGALTDRARKALKLAKHEARRLGHNYVGTEHLLLGLMRDAESVAVVVLRELGVEPSAVRSAIELVVRQGDRYEDDGGLELTPRASKALELARDVARELSHHYIGTEHLLLGLLLEGEGIAAGVLQSLGVTYEDARAGVLRASTRAVGAPPAAKSNVITCRIDSHDLDALDALVEAGVRSTRSDAAAWLIHAGIEAKSELLERVYGTVTEIRRLRDEVARSLSEGTEVGSGST